MPGILQICMRQILFEMCCFWECKISPICFGDGPYGYPDTQEILHMGYFCELLTVLNLTIISSAVLVSCNKDIIQTSNLWPCKSSRDNENLLS